MWLAADLPADTFGTTVFGGGIGHEAHQIDNALAFRRLVGEGAETLVAVAKDDHVGVIDDLIEVGIQQRGNVWNLRFDVVLVGT